MQCAVIFCQSGRICGAFADIISRNVSRPARHSLAGRGLNKAIWSLECYNIRDFATDKHANVDAPPFGGGHGMVMRPDVMGRAIDHVCNKQSAGQNLAKLYPSPRGKLLDQDMARSLSQKDGVMIVCGRYEGLDQRVIDHYQLQEVSIGDYVLSGGEQAAMVILDAVVRLLPGIMGKEVSHLEDSFESGLLEHHHYTQPRDWQGLQPPEILLSGHHQNIAKMATGKCPGYHRNAPPGSDGGLYG